MPTPNIPLIQTANTFDFWRIQTNNLINVANELRTTTYEKEAGLLYLSRSTGTALQVVANVLIQDTLTVGTFSSTTGFVSGTLTAGTLIASTANITGNLTTSNLSVTGTLSLPGITNLKDSLISAANTVRISANSGSFQGPSQLNFVNSSSVIVSVTSGPSGNANVAFSVVGGSGAQGAAGSPGAQGATGVGSPGAQGAAGSPGAQGASGGGAQGAAGSPGAQGAAGSPGAQGASGGGAQGVQGRQGATGSPGAQGASGGGAQGAAGSPGAQGATGVGSPGAQGAAGSPGAQGATGVGSPGAQGSAGSPGAQGASGLSGGSTTDLEIRSLGVGTAASGVQGEIRATNDITAYYSSDVRLKENIRKIENALELIAKIEGVRYDWKDEYIERRGGIDDYFVRKEDIGVIAQDLQKVLPEVVAERPDGYLAVRYEKIVALLLAALKELKKEVDDIKKRL